jgi:hypothetical protein
MVKMERVTDIKYNVMNEMYFIKNINMVVG